MENIENNISTGENQSDLTVNGVENVNETVIKTEEVNIAPENQVESTEATNPTESIDDSKGYAKAFSKRLSKEREKLSKEYEPFKKVIQLASKQFNMSENEYIESILKDYAEEEGTPTTPKEKDERDALIEELLNEKKEKEVAKEWETQANALKSINPNISMEELTDEMFEMSHEKKIPLEFIYAHNLLTKGREQFEKTIENKLRSKIDKANITAGALTSNQVETPTPNISKMTDKDFKDLTDRVKRGEKVSF